MDWNEWEAYLMQMECTSKHAIGRIPVDIAVEGNRQEWFDSTVALKNFKVLDLLTSALNLCDWLLLVYNAQLFNAPW